MPLGESRLRATWWRCNNPGGAHGGGGYGGIASRGDVRPALCAACRRRSWASCSTGRGRHRGSGAGVPCARDAACSRPRHGRSLARSSRSPGTWGGGLAAVPDSRIITARGHTVKCGATARAMHPGAAVLSNGGDAAGRALRHRRDGTAKLWARRSSRAHFRGRPGACVAALLDGVHFVVGLGTGTTTTRSAVPRRRDARPHLRGAQRQALSHSDARRPAHHQWLD